MSARLALTDVVVGKTVIVARSCNDVQFYLVVGATLRHVTLKRLKRYRFHESPRVEGRLDLVYPSKETARWAMSFKVRMSALKKRDVFDSENVYSV